MPHTINATPPLSNPLANPLSNPLANPLSNPLASRRSWLSRFGLGLGAVAASELLAKEIMAGALPTDEARRASNQTGLHFPARAKRVIFLFMHGGPSHLDTFDYKPSLMARDGQPLPFAKPRIQFAQTGELLKSPWRFRQHGLSGAWISELFPELSGCADDLIFIKSMHGSNEAHGGALLKIHTGSDTFVRPSMGAWISYGLGTENENLPSFVTINPSLGHGGVQNFGSAFLPPEHQATRIGGLDLVHRRASMANLTNPQWSPSQQREQLDLTQILNRDRFDTQGPDLELEARMESMELAFRMQSEAPSLMELNYETANVERLYGIDRPHCQKFGLQCLLARRLSEAGVRFVQVTHGYWDQHAELTEKHAELAREVDRPIFGLLTDLKQRGLLDETLVIWGAEFGRTPTGQGRNGRDHNPHAFTYWLAGAGVKKGVSYGESDEFGFYAAVDKVHVHDFHATLLHLLGIDHLRLTYRHGGRDFRLTDVHGSVVHSILS